MLVAQEEGLPLPVFDAPLVGGRLDLAGRWRLSGGGQVSFALGRVGPKADVYGVRFLLSSGVECLGEGRFDGAVLAVRVGTPTSRPSAAGSPTTWRWYDSMA